MLFAAGGCLLALPPFGVWPLAWLAPAPLLARVASAAPRRALALGGGWGVLYFAGILYWTHGVMVRYGGLSPWVAAGPLALLVLYLSVDFAVFLWLVSAGVRRWGRIALWAAPALWTAQEWQRGWIAGGFPWGLLASALSGVPSLLAPAAWIGAYGLGTLMAVAWAGVALLLTSRWSRRRALAAFAAGAGALALLAAFGAARVHRIEALPRTLRVACVQANVPQAIKWSEAHRLEIVAAHRALTQEAAAGGARLVLWPESSLPFDPGEPIPWEDGALPAEAWVAGLARESGADIVWGGATVIPGEEGMSVRNSALLSRADGMPAARYDKRRLVPFGEYVPFSRWLAFARPLVHRVGEFEPGGTAVLQRSTHADLGSFICYEILFSNLVRDSAREAQVLVSLTNDAWFGNSTAPHLHAAAAALRAAESGLPLARAANTGISALVLPSGRIVAATALGEQRLLEGDLPLGGAPTFHRRHGDLWAHACAMISAAFLILLAAASLRTALERGRRRAGSPTHA